MGLDDDQERIFLRSTVKHMEALLLCCHQLNTVHLPRQVVMEDDSRKAEEWWRKPRRFVDPTMTLPCRIYERPFLEGRKTSPPFCSRCFAFLGLSRRLIGHGSLLQGSITLPCAPSGAFCPVTDSRPSEPNPLQETSHLRCETRPV